MSSASRQTGRPGVVLTRERAVRIGVCAAVAVVVTGGVMWLRGSARAACDITSPLLNGIDLVEYGIVALLLIGAACALFEALGWGWWVVPAVVAVALGAAWLLLWRTQPPPDHPVTVSACTENLPTWWPAAFPG